MIINIDNINILTLDTLSHDLLFQTWPRPLISMFHWVKYWKASFVLRFYGPLCSSLTFWVLCSDSVDNDNNCNDDNSYSNINDNNVGHNDMNNNNSFRKYGLSYPEPSWKNYLS